ncbi:helix-turn-helix domain-containing protein [Ensifer sp. 1H6]|uniref:Crp/Fnr family transcriptional regulator n=1 Tax=Ensifer sp. 1H6 TaxID=1911585 RepID=UPI00046CAC1F|nr:helix-turn-helix domain-containing protein [Ensifer sp. 1H6]OMQ42928.1 Crp/Fnr family transcriptional regulator [Ensifer sp. 1H6]
MNMQLTSVHLAKQISTENAPLAATDLSSLFIHQPRERFAAGAPIFWEGDRATHVYEVTDGMLRAVRLLSDGRRIIVGFLRPGDLLGVSFRDQYIYTVEAVTKVELRRFPRHLFEGEIARQPILRELLFSRLCDEMSAAQDQAVLLSRRSADEKLASFLLRMASRRIGQHMAVDLPMTRQDIADYLGMTIETVSRTTTKLSNSGIVATPDRHIITILRMDALRSIAEGEECETWFAPSTFKMRRQAGDPQNAMDEHDRQPH